MKYPSLVRLPRRDEIIPEWSNRPCPHCGTGKLNKLTFYPYRKVWAHRCSAKFCQKYVQPHEFHSIFAQGAGASKTSLQTQASILLCWSKIMDVDDKIVSRIYNSLDIARARFVLAHEKHIQNGGSARWVDVEADEVNLGKGLVENYDKSKLDTKWEQWLGVVHPEVFVSSGSIRRSQNRDPRDQDPSGNETGNQWPSSIWRVGESCSTRMAQEPTSSS